jgi:uroporphyrinogen-III synthase
MSELPLHGRVIGVTAERRADVQADRFRKRGADVLHGPALRVFSLAEDEVLRETTLEIIGDPPDYLLASTGFGMRTWLTAAREWGLDEGLIGVLGRARVANRGAKAASANTAAGLVEWWRAPNERFEEVVQRVLEEPLAGARVVVQLHAAAQPHAAALLERAGATVLEVDAYRSSLPLDPGPARALIEAACSGELAAVTFTTAPAVHNLFALARQIERDGALREAFNGSVVAACVGPVCAEGALEEGVAEPLVPTRPRLVPLVVALTDRLSGAGSRPDGLGQRVEELS